ncbi:hypothetical protein CPLU01_05541 [Colletotrichum plurivorum]|uniref:Uncharacterized protein n=1 Tax=Colletotrichum plurivorum TaxID=2175906 RepID=A0A8H6KLK5_9PEZI|nr:hypothetical protein CPLU01_05541 [Colletotrichum plurivorum]
MEKTPKVRSVSYGAPFQVFFDGPHSEVVSATYQLDRLLKRDNHSDIFCLRYLSIDAPDPNPTGRVLEARRFIIDGSDGLPPSALQYRLRSARRLASRQLRTSISKNDQEFYVVYTTEKTLPSPKDGPSSPKVIDLEESQRMEVKALERQVRAAEKERDRSYKEWSEAWYNPRSNQEEDVDIVLANIAIYYESINKVEAVEEDFAAALWRYLGSLVSRKGTCSISSGVTALVWLTKAAEKHNQKP